jgi:hypothetical protein
LELSGHLGSLEWLEVCWFGTGDRGPGTRKIKSAAPLLPFRVPGPRSLVPSSISSLTAYPS